jgi:hypothetical protein
VRPDGGEGLIRLPALFLALRLAGPSSIPSTSSVSADLDGDGAAETVTAAPARDGIRVEVRDAAGRRLARAKAPVPSGDVVPFELLTAPLGSVGALLAVTAATDVSACRTIWRFRDGTLARIPVRDAAGRQRPDCESPGGWSERFERPSEGRPSALVRERVEKTARGNLRTRETYAFAGFSLDFDPKRSSVEIDGIPIPSWYPATLYTRAALERLYGRFGLAALREEPTLRIEADPARGVFDLRFAGPSGVVVAPVEAYAESGGTATLAARARDATAHVTVRLAGADGRVPMEARVEGLGRELDALYAPAGSWQGGSRKVFPGAADEIASESLAGLWGDARGKSQTIAIEGEPPYRVRMEGALYRVDLERAAAPIDLLLLPDGGAGRPWGIVLRGPNALERVPLACSGGSAAFACRSDGDAETLRRIGARVNVR